MEFEIQVLRKQLEEKSTDSIQLKKEVIIQLFFTFNLAVVCANAHKFDTV